eukprot:3610481-Amphidinium_carterae.2
MEQRIADFARVKVLGVQLAHVRTVLELLESVALHLHAHDQCKLARATHKSERQCYSLYGLITTRRST